MTERDLEAEWARIYALHRVETLRTYRETVEKGNKQTYSEFVEDIRKDWIEEMRKRG